MFCEVVVEELRAEELVVEVINELSSLSCSSFVKLFGLNSRSVTLCRLKSKRMLQKRMTCLKTTLESVLHSLPSAQ
jgi:hypothetical protein